MRASCGGMPNLQLAMILAIKYLRCSSQMLLIVVFTRDRKDFCVFGTDAWMDKFLELTHFVAERGHLNAGLISFLDFMA